MHPISVTLLVVHVELSGKVVNNEQSLKIQTIFLTLIVSHLEISGKDFNEEQ